MLLVVFRLVATQTVMVRKTKLKIDFEYIVQLLQGFVDSFNCEDGEYKENEYENKFQQLREIVNDFSKITPKLGVLLNQILDEIAEDKEKFIG